MAECEHRWRKWEKEQHIYWKIEDKDQQGYYQRRECLRCGVAEPFVGLPQLHIQFRRRGHVSAGPLRHVEERPLYRNPLLF